MPVTVAFILPSFNGGGAERVLLELCKSIDRIRYRPIIFAFTDHGPLRTFLDSQIEVRDLNSPKLRNAIWPLRRELARLRPDVVVSTMGYLNLGLLFLKPFLPDKTWLIIREANEVEATLSAIGPPVAGRLLYRWLYPRADRILSPSQTIVQSLRDITGLPEDRISLLANPVDVNRLRSAAKPLYRHPGLGVRLVATGRLTLQKGFDRLLDMFARLPGDAHLTILGEGEDLLALKSQCRGLGAQERVDFPGHVSQPWRYMGGADAFLLPSRREGMPNAALEALACGTPVIATPEAGGIVEVAEEAAAGAVTLAAVGDQFTQAMTRVLAETRTTLRPSLLPDRFDLLNVVSSFEQLLRDPG